MEKFVEGQRWISETEPELGLGTITGIEHRRIHVSFYGSRCERMYAIAAAPVKRVRFKPGDEIKSRHDLTMSVETVKEVEGIIVYCGDGLEFHESELSDSISFSTPKDRLLNGLVDMKTVFALRCAALGFRAKSSASSVRGFLGGRVKLIPHQFYIAREVASRHVPRILLSDEVGLGKTIEASLILHRLLLCERIGRVLILVPETLVNQWFVELWRRFNLLFRIFNAEYCMDSEKNGSEINPFLEDQLGICSIDFFQCKVRRQQVVAAGWDMLIVDEAHHLVENSSEYELVEMLGQKSSGMMLLTATPEQLGERSHFSHLRLLDPARFYDFDDYVKNAGNYRSTAEFIDKISEQGSFTDKEVKAALDDLSDPSEETFEYFSSLLHGCEDDKKQLVDEILDRHGTGRIIFRNTRATIKGFPRRIENLYPLSGTTADIRRSDLELLADIKTNEEKPSYDYSTDPRVTFIVELIQRFKDEKILLICRSREQTIAVESAVKQKINVKIGLFNESMTLLQRDRSAAWFSEKTGAQILICSEIGSEGRNFQFAHHLVMFDLPLNPELLEQRIGRLDRIGQERDIHIHVPYTMGSTAEILVKWYSNGLGLFENNVSGVHHIYKKYGQRIVDIVKQQMADGLSNAASLDALLEGTKLYQTELAQQLEKGRDRLLELNSFRSDRSAMLIDEINAIDKCVDIDDFMLRMFAYFGIRADEAGERTYRLKFDGVERSDFPVPVLRNNGMLVTFDRDKALSREDIDFLSRDHPMVTGSVELLLGTEQGNSSIAVWNDSGEKGILLEAYFVPECVAPVTLHMDRFLPGTPFRLVVDHSGRDVTGDYSVDLFENHLENHSGAWLLENPLITGELLPQLVQVIQTSADDLNTSMISSAVSKMVTVMDKEIQRLQHLKRVNPAIRDVEIDAMIREQETLRTYLNASRLRLDALRLILLR